MMTRTNINGQISCAVLTFRALKAFGSGISNQGIQNGLKIVSGVADARLLIKVTEQTQTGLATNGSICLRNLARD